MDFDGRFTASAIGASGTGDGGADFLLGLDYQYGRGVSTGKTWQQASNVFGIYAQDTWRFTDRLTINLGLRYDAHSPWVESNNQQANYNIATGKIDLAGQNGASRGLYDGTWGGKDFQPRIGFAWISRGTGRPHRDPRCVHNFVLSGRYGHEPPFDAQPTFHSGINQRHLQRRCPTRDEYIGWDCGFSLGGILRCARLCLLRRGFPPRLGSQGTACDRGMERDCPTPICRQYHRPSWIRRAEGNSLDGAIRLCAETVATEWDHGSEPILCREPHAVLSSGASECQPSCCGCYRFRYQVEWHHEIQLIASRPAEADDPRFAVSGRIYTLKVHVG